VNPSTSEARVAEIVLRGGTAKNASMSFLANADIHAHNTFAQPDVVVVQTKALSVRGEGIVVELPAASVAAVSVELG